MMVVERKEEASGGKREKSEIPKGRCHSNDT